MSAGSVGETLVAAGLDSSEARAKDELYERVRRLFDRVIGGGAECGCWVPGRLELFGTHTDYAGGRTLVSALPHGFLFLGRGRRDHHLRLVDARNEDSHSPEPATSLQSPVGSSDWRQYGRVVFKRLARNFPGAPLGADLVFASDLPMAAGMSSSSALMVGVATCLARLANLRRRPEWRQNIRGPLDEAGYYACIENGSAFGTLTGDSGVGTHGGSEDHAAMVCGTGGALTAYAFAPMRRLDTIRLPEDWCALVIASGVVAEKTGAVRQFYNRLSAGAATLVELWNRRESPAPSLAAALASVDDAPARLRAAIRTARVAGWSPEELDARLEHFLTEDARVPAALEAIRQADRQRVGRLAASSQAGSERLLQNQVPETIALVRIALACGAFASRSFGAGFGGSVWALTTGQEHHTFLEKWLDGYRASYPTAHPAALLAQPGPTVVELAL